MEDNKVISGFVILAIGIILLGVYFINNYRDIEHCNEGFRLDKSSYADVEGNLYPGCIRCEGLFSKTCYHMKLKETSYLNDYMNIDYFGGEKLNS